MKRLQLLVILAVITAATIWLSFYRSRHTSSTAVAVLLPKETLAFFYLPDIERARSQFRQTDLYQLWTEPGLREFLQKPRTKIAHVAGLQSFLENCRTLQIKDAFLAVLGANHETSKIVGGFRFKGEPNDAEQIMANWKTQLLPDSQNLSHETITYQDHKIQVDTTTRTLIASVYDAQWCFVSNDPEQLKRLLDRVDGRVNNVDSSLARDESFVAASKRMPSNYAGLVFAHVNQLAEKFIPAANRDVSSNQLAAIRQIQSLAVATGFDGGKIRDTIFIGMPELLHAGDLTRASLRIATKDAFLYATGFLNLTQPVTLPGSQGVLGWAGGLRQITRALESNGITLENWNTAFAPELSWIGEWPTSAHWPSLVAILSVKDPAKANRILNVITAADNDSVVWTRREKDGVQYFSARSSAQLFSLSPSIGLSDKMLVIGADSASVEMTMKRSAIGPAELATSKIFLKAESTVPAAKQAFAYVDPVLFYTRVDATLRPILIMSAAFLPGIVDTVDFSKLPPPETMTKHLSPIVMSQSYDGEGYVAESIGPITFGEAIIALGGVGAIAAILYQQQIQR